MHKSVSHGRVLLCTPVFANSSAFEDFLTKKTTNNAIVLQYFKINIDNLFLIFLHLQVPTHLKWDM